VATRKIAIVIKVEGADTAKTKTDKMADSQKRFALTLRQTNAEARRQEKHLQQMAIGAAKLSHAQNGLTNSFIKGNLAARGISIATTNITRAMKFGASQAVKFEFSLAKIQAITGTAGLKLNQLEKTIRGIAVVSPKTSAQVADAALAMAKLGLSADEVQGGLEGVVNLSVALDESVERVGETIVNIKNVFGKEASELGDVTDKLFANFANSALNLDKFSTAFSFAGGTAKLAGVEFEELTALMGALSDSGIKASTIGTQLRSVMLDLSSSSSKAGKAIGGDISTFGIVGALERVRDLNLDPASTKSIFGKRAVSVVGALTGSIDKVEELIEISDKAKGVSEEAATILSGTVQGALKEVTSSWTEMWNSALDSRSAGLVGTLQEIAGIMRGLAGANKGLDQAAVVRASEEALENARVLAGFTQEEIDANTGKLKFLEEFAAFQSKQKEKQDEINKLALEAAQAEHDKKRREEARIERLKRIKKLVQDIRTEQSLRALGVEAGSPEADIQTLLNEKVIGSRKVLLEVNTLLASLRKEETDAILADARLVVENNEKKIKQLKEQERLAKLNLDIKKKEVEIAQKAFDATFEAQLNLKLTKILTDQLKNSVDSVSRAFSNNLTNAILGNKGAMIDFGNVFKQIVINMIGQITALLVKMALFKTLTTGLGLASGAGTFTSLLTGFGLNADGFEGQVNRPTGFIAGEAGSEQISIRPKSAVGGSQNGSQNQIIFQGPVYGMDDFVDKVNQANEQIEKDFI